jgi:hypothetical protein
MVAVERFSVFGVEFSGNSEDDLTWRRSDRRVGYFEGET